MISDEQLSRIYRQEKANDMEEIPADFPTHTFSHRFNCKIRTILFVQKYILTNNRTVRLLKFAATAAIVVMIVYGTSASNVIANRTNFWIENIGANTQSDSVYDELHVSGNDIGYHEKIPMKITYIPEGFVEVERTCDDAANTYFYDTIDTSNDYYIMVNQIYKDACFDMSVELDKDETEFFTLDGNDACYYENETCMKLLWSDENSTFLIVYYGTELDRSDIMDIYNGITK